MDRLWGWATGEIYFGIVIKLTDGGFAGKYELPLNLRGTETGEFDVEVPFEDLGRVSPESRWPIGTEVVELWWSTYDQDERSSEVTVVECRGRISGGVYLTQAKAGHVRANEETKW